MNMNTVNTQKSQTNKFKVSILTTGGTIEKVYDERVGALVNKDSLIQSVVLSKLRLPYTEVEVQTLFNKDSLYMDDKDREFIATSIRYHMEQCQAIVVVHGTDTMQVSAEYCFNSIKNPPIPILFTGAMRPLGYENSDAIQNITEALSLSKVIGPGFYVAFHGQLFNVPKVRKNHERGTFEAF